LGLIAKISVDFNLASGFRMGPSNQLYRRKTFK